MDLEGARWRKSSFTEQGECVEVALISDTAAIRDTKNRTGGTLTVPESAWRSLIRAV